MSLSAQSSSMALRRSSTTLPLDGSLSTVEFLLSSNISSAFFWQLLVLFIFCTILTTICNYFLIFSVFFTRMQAEDSDPTCVVYQFSFTLKGFISLRADSACGLRLCSPTCPFPQPPPTVLVSSGKGRLWQVTGFCSIILLPKSCTEEKKNFPTVQRGSGEQQRFRGGCQSEECGCSEEVSRDWQPVSSTVNVGAIAEGCRAAGRDSKLYLKCLTSSPYTPIAIPFLASVSTGNGDVFSGASVWWRQSRYT